MDGNISVYRELEISWDITSELTKTRGWLVKPEKKKNGAGKDDVRFVNQR